MNDQKLKIRIQIAQQPKSIDELYPAAEKQQQPDKPPFDRQKIMLALVLLTVITGLISYFIVSWNNQQPLPAEIQPVRMLHHKDSPADDISSAEFNVQVADQKDVDLSLSENESLVDPIPNEILDETDLASTSLTAAADSSEELDESALATANSLLSNTLNDQPQVIRAQLTSGIQEREPIDIIDHVWLDEDTPTKKIFFFVQLGDLMGQRVSVHWHYQEREVAKVPLLIGSQKWRTYANKILSKSALGSWHVTLHDQSGKLLARRNFTVGKRP